MDASVKEFGARRLETPIKEKFEEFIKLLEEEECISGFDFIGVNLGILANEVAEEVYTGCPTGVLLFLVGAILKDGYTNREDSQYDRNCSPCHSPVWNSPLTPERKEFISKISLVMAENEKCVGRDKLVEYLQEFSQEIRDGRHDDYSYGEAVAVISQCYLTYVFLMEEGGE